MDLKIIARFFAILFIIIGIAGHMPICFQNRLLFGFFRVEPIDQIGNLVIGAIAFLASFSDRINKLFFQIFGILFGLLSIMTFIWQNNPLFIKVNLPDHIFQIFIAIVFLCLGFYPKQKTRFLFK